MSEVEKTCVFCEYEFEDTEGTHCRHCIHNATENFKEKKIHSVWIPCSERLPMHGQYVIASLEKPNRNINGGHPIILTEYKCESWWESGIIVAWMPLPKPYEMKGE